MKKKAGQAQESYRSSEVRSSALVPVNDNASGKPSGRGSRDEWSAPSEFTEFDYKSLGKSVNTSSPKKKSSGKTSKKSSSDSFDYSGKSTAKKTKSKKKSAAGPVIAIVAALLLVAGAALGALYYFGFFDEKVDVTLADGTVQTMKVEEAYAELATDRFYAGTVVNGIDIGGMTQEEAFNAVSTNLPEIPLVINITLDLEGKKLAPNFHEVSFEYNTKEILDDAFSKCRPVDKTDLNRLIECYNGMQQLKNKPMVYETAYTVHIDGVQEVVKKVLNPYLTDYATVKNATIVDFDTENKTYIIDKEKIGYKIDVDATSKAVKALFDSKTYVGIVKVPTEKMEPEITEAMIKENFGLIGECTTKTSANNNRNNNIRQACENMNGTILDPGEVFSFNDTVGQRTADNGFKEATVIMGGQYEQGLGGGICQVSSTLYNAVLKADLKVVKRSAHAWPSDYVQTGLDATVDWPALDFQFENDSDYQVVVLTWFDSSDNTCNAQIYGKKLPDGKYIELYAEISSITSAGSEEYVEDRELPMGERKTIREAHQGITANAYKIWYNADGEEIDRVLYNTTYYAAYGKRVAIGVLKPDGTYATFNKDTGEYNEPVPTSTNTPTPKPTTKPSEDPTKPTKPTEPDPPTPTPESDPPTPTPTEPDPPTDPPTPVPAENDPKPTTPEPPDNPGGEESE